MVIELSYVNSRISGLGLKIEIIEGERFKGIDFFTSNSHYVQ